MESPAPDQKDGEVSEQQNGTEPGSDPVSTESQPERHDPANGEAPDPASGVGEAPSRPENGEASDPASVGEREREGDGEVEADLGTPEVEESGILTERSVSEGKGGQLGGEGNRTFTMRELLSELKEENGTRSVGENESNGGDVEREPDSSRSQDSLQQHYTVQNDVAMELINNVTGVDEEGRSRQRILSFAAKRYATAIERNPDDHDAYYNWALVLQESADNVGPDSGPSKDALLEEACKKYEEAIRLCPTLHDAYYNWAIAISDRAKLRGRTNEAEELWKQATKNYEKAVQLNWNSPQALNNWGLALQELSAIVPLKEKPSIVRTAISKFRAAIQLQFDFHRAIYNLGTVLYGLAEDTLRSGRPVNAKEVSPNELYSLSAIYIGAAHSLKPNYSVYRSALRLVRSMLPLPYLKVGYLTAPPAKNPIAPHTDWERSQFVLNHEGLQQVNKDDPKPPSHSGRSPNHIDRSMIKVDIPDIVSVSACADLTLPPGAGLFIDTIHRPVYLVADTWESLDGWLDAIRLVYTIYARGKSDVLAGIISS